jgi:hypothetical protein
MKQLHAKELLKLEKWKMKEKDINRNIIRKEKVVVKKTLGT